jgi:hypothetical protein
LPARLFRSSDASSAEVPAAPPPPLACTEERAAETRGEGAANTSGGEGVAATASRSFRIRGTKILCGALIKSRFVRRADLE